MPHVAPGLLRLAALAAVLVGLSLLQRVVPTLPTSATPAETVVRVAPGGSPAPVAVYAAVGLPGLEKTAKEVPLASMPLAIDPEFALAVLGDFPWQPERLPFVPPSEAGRVRPLILNGHGDFHHLTYFLLSALIEPQGEPYTVVSFDAHDDMRGPRAIVGPDAALMANQIDMGNWGRWALARLPNLQRIVQPGTVIGRHFDLSTWLAGEVHGGRAVLLPAAAAWTYFSEPSACLGPQLEARPDLLARLGGRRGTVAWNPGWDHRPESLLSHIKTRSVYVTVDLDLLQERDFDDLHWGTGKTSLDEVLVAIDALASKHLLLGADVTGFPPDRRVAQAWSHEKCFLAYQQVGLALFNALQGNQPRQPRAPAEPCATAECGAPTASPVEGR